jgi:hypothetical protein
MTQVFEQDNRRAEVNGASVQFFRVSGNSRRSKSGVWFTTCDNENQAKRLARRWAFRGRLGESVLH